MAEIHGSNFSERIDGTIEVDEIFAYGGNDNVFGHVGNDTLHGGDGADSLDGGDGVDVLNGDAGDDILRGGAGNDALDGGAGTADIADYSQAAAGVTVNLLTGSAANDGDGGTDQLTGIDH